MTALRQAVLQAVLDRPEGATLSELAQVLGRAPPPVLHHLQSLVQEGLLSRNEGGGGSNRPRYVAQPYFSATLVMPEARAFAAWSISDRVSWRFPLTSRVPDKRARDAVVLFLRALDRRGLFTRPYLLTKEAKRGRKLTKGVKVGEDVERAYGWRLVVYGSVARGQASPSSDVDLLALPGSGLRPDAFAEAMKDEAAEVNLSAPRRIDINVHDGARPAPPSLVESVRRDGFVVYSTYDGGEYEPILEGSS